MRISVLKLALCAGVLAAVSFAPTYDASATSLTPQQKASKKAEKKAKADAEYMRGDLMKHCRRLSYARTPGGAMTLDSEMRLKEIDACYRNGGRLL